jgi:hypothetical protein
MCELQAGCQQDPKSWQVIILCAATKEGLDDLFGDA